MTITICGLFKAVVVHERDFAGLGVNDPDEASGWVNVILRLISFRSANTQTFYWYLQSSITHNFCPNSSQLLPEIIELHKHRAKLQEVLSALKMNPL